MVRKLISSFLGAPGSGREMTRKQPRRALLALERLADRMLPASASFANGILTVFGDAGVNNNLVIRREVSGNISVFDNGVPVAVSGGTPTVSTTTRIVADGLSGDDSIA